MFSRRSMQLAAKAGRKAGAQKCRCKQLLWKGIKKKMHGTDNKQGEYPVRARACGLYAHPKLFTGSKPVSIALGSGEKQKLGKAAWRPWGSWIDRGRLVLCGFGADLWGDQQVLVLARNFFSHRFPNWFRKLQNAAERTIMDQVWRD